MEASALCRLLARSLLRCHWKNQSLEWNEVFHPNIGKYYCKEYIIRSFQRKLFISFRVWRPIEQSGAGEYECCACD